MVLVLKKFASLLCTVALLLSAAFVPTVASASSINTELVGNPTAALAEIEKIGLPLSDEMAGEVRGEVWPATVVAALGYIYYVAVIYGVPYAVNYAASLTNGTWIMKETIKQQVKQYFGWN